MDDFFRQMFCVPSIKDGKYRVSLTKTGSAIQMFSVTVGGSLAGLSFLAQHQQAAAITAGVFIIIGGIGRWIEAVGRRDAMK